MRLSDYEEIYAQIKSRDDIAPIAEARGIPYDTLVSIYSTKYQRTIKRKIRVHHDPKNVARYVARWRQGDRILDMAESINFSPSLLARLLMGELQKWPKPQVSKAIKDPSIIEDPRLREEVTEANEADDNYSPSIDIIRRNVGLEYELVLLEKLHAVGLPYVTEEQLRKEGFPKTPDVRPPSSSACRAVLQVKLQIPIEVAGRVVNWIDSKAAFGDLYYHNTVNMHLKSYVNRFGPGMVIYWFGFVDDLNEDPNQKDVLVVEDFPTQIETLRVGGCEVTF